jgi:uncharacterized protein (UPF0297 family)
MPEKLSKDTIEEIKKIIETLNSSIFDKGYNTINVLNVIINKKEQKCQ